MSARGVHLTKFSFLSRKSRTIFYFSPEVHLYSLHPLAVRLYDDMCLNCFSKITCIFYTHENSSSRHHINHWRFSLRSVLHQIRLYTDVCRLCESSTAPILNSGICWSCVYVMNWVCTFQCLVFLVAFTTVLFLLLEHVESLKLLQCAVQFDGVVWKFVM